MSCMKPPNPDLEVCWKKGFSAPMERQKGASGSAWCRRHFNCSCETLWSHYSCVSSSISDSNHLASLWGGSTCLMPRQVRDCRLGRGIVVGDGSSKIKHIYFLRVKLFQIRISSAFDFHVNLNRISVFAVHINDVWTPIYMHLGHFLIFSHMFSLQKALG